MPLKYVQKLRSGVGLGSTAPRPGASTNIIKTTFELSTQELRRSSLLCTSYANNLPLFWLAADYRTCPTHGDWPTLQGMPVIGDICAISLRPGLKTLSGPVYTSTAELHTPRHRLY
jgi:hypothetical protein